MEMLSAAKGIAQINEPFDRRFIINSPFLTDAGLTRSAGKYILLPSAADYRKSIHGYLADHKNVSVCRQANPFAHNFRLASQRLLYKIIHTNLCMTTVAECGIHWQKIFVFRHPVPTILSQMKVYSGDTLESLVKPHEIDRMDLSQDQVEHVLRAASSNDTLLRFATLWCLEHVAINKQLHSHQNGWLFTSYESILANPHTELERLCHHLEIKDLGAVLSSASLASMSTSLTSLDKLKARDQSSLIHGWRSRIANNELEKVFCCLKVFNLDFYGRDQSVPTGALAAAMQR
jgi:hypothetical protein